jgi:RimJ/RimL family protein N-acetyltransferase
VIDEPHWHKGYGEEVLDELLSHAFGAIAAQLIVAVFDLRHPHVRKPSLRHGFRQDKRYSLIPPDLGGNETLLPWCDSPEILLVTPDDFGAVLRQLM